MPLPLLPESRSRHRDGRDPLHLMALRARNEVSFLPLGPTSLTAPPPGDPEQRQRHEEPRTAVQVLVEAGQEPQRARHQQQRRRPYPAGWHPRHAAHYAAGSLGARGRMFDRQGQRQTLNAMDTAMLRTAIRQVIRNQRVALI